MAEKKEETQYNSWQAISTMDYLSFLIWEKVFVYSTDYFSFLLLMVKYNL